jgi:N-acetylglutamate synthase-like GNAT family acetyltransferase
MEEYFINDDKSRLDLNLVHQQITNSYWAKGRTFEEVKRSIDNSICYGVYIANKRVGFARVLSDLTTIAYIMDLFIIEEQKGNGLSKMFLKKILNEARFSSVKKWMLATKDAHSLYEKFGFGKVKNSKKYLERINSTD